ncbi:hypothetical protein DEO72_LG3g895 [Vigna unguiculata]|uniref:Uncharacterized protein n=1 Tax=Vigna unguiculata TaxID=3917 RepID=A0A4D6LDN2_VIGUN|nr:hypothetical protein DEO72_LG3g895 [Vigna unguiculata]
MRGGRESEGGFEAGAVVTKLRCRDDEEDDGEKMEVLHRGGSAVFSGVVARRCLREKMEARALQVQFRRGQVRWRWRLKMVVAVVVGASPAMVWRCGGGCHGGGRRKEN